jgi:hypothetical protein
MIPVWIGLPNRPKVLILTFSRLRLLNGVSLITTYACASFNSYCSHLYCSHSSAFLDAQASSAKHGSKHAYIIDVELICASCNDDTNKCLNDGICRTDGMCKCENGATGDWCQIQPTYNGHCDTYYNKHEFNYDGGDCCESTCVSTDMYTCGKDESGIVDMGYHQCNIKTEPYDQWFQSGNPVNIINVNAGCEIHFLVALGGRGGTVLAVGYSGASVVRLFDKDGSKWVQRGEELKGPIDSLFGRYISLSSGESENVMMNDYSSPTVTLAVDGYVYDLGFFVKVYGCSTSGCEQIGSDIILGSAFSVSLSRGEIHVLFPIILDYFTNSQHASQSLIYLYFVRWEQACNWDRVHS